MAIKQILFDAEMVRAILEGRKSCIRRLVKFFSGENPRWTGYIKDGLMLYNGKMSRVSEKLHISRAIFFMSAKHGEKDMKREHIFTGLVISWQAYLHSRNRQS